MGSTSVSTIVEKWRADPPASYSIKIHSFSQLENSTAFSDYKYQSGLFSSSGYDWRLILYPNGNEKDDGNGFISMYVEIDSTSLNVYTPSQVSAELRFFVYNKKENKYFTIQDVEVKRFNALKTVWGLGKVLPYDTFNDPGNGYLFEGDQCEFGVNVIVSPSLANWEILSFNEKIPYPKYLWAVKKFSELTKYVHVSNPFTKGGRKWVLKLYPKGNSREDGKWLSVFLFLADSDVPEAGEKIFMQGHVRILHPLGSNHFERQFSDWHDESNSGWGWDQFLSLDEVWNVYLDNEDTLNIEIEFQVVSATKYSSISDSPFDSNLFGVHGIS